MFDVRVILKALTAEMDLAFRGPVLELRELPFRLGRDSRDQHAPAGPPAGSDRRKGLRPTNDLYLVESGSRLHVSRQHLMIEQREHGIYLVDLFSSCGTIVEGRYLGGGHKGGEIVLEHNDVVIVGGASSPYLFKVLLQ